MEEDNIKQSKMLEGILKYFKPYLEDELNNELIFDKGGEFFIDRGGESILVKDENLNSNNLQVFLRLLANSRGFEFNKRNPTLSTSIPNTTYRVQAAHESILGNQELQLNIRIPAKKIYPIESFEIGEKCIFTHNQILGLIAGDFNIVVSGGTGSGKTSFLNSCLQSIDEKVRIVTVEDSPELKIKNKNKTSILVEKGANAKFTYADGFNLAMRLFPERLILGEIDIQNTLAFLRMNNSGHKGNITSVHTNSVDDCLEGIYTNIIMSGHNMTIEAFNQLASKSVDYIIQITRDMKTNKRIIAEVLNVRDYFAKNTK